MKPSINKQNVTEEIKPDKSNQPVGYTNVGRVSVAQFDNVSEDGKHFSSFSVTMSYKDDKGEYHRGTSFSLTDLANLLVAVNRALNKALDGKEEE